MGVLTTFSVSANVPTLIRRSASETLPGAMAFSKKSLHPVKLGAEAPHRTNAGGHFVMSAAQFEYGSKRVSPLDV